MASANNYQRGTDSNTVIVGDFNTSLTSRDRGKFIAIQTYFKK